MGGLESSGRWSGYRVVTDSVRNGTGKFGGRRRGASLRFGAAEMSRPMRARLAHCTRGKISGSLMSRVR
jgi:hypothetical protein